MSKLSSPLKALISAPFARPNVLPAPRNISAVYERISREARTHNVGTAAWLSVATAATMTMNSPDSLSQLYKTMVREKDARWPPARTAEFMREVGLKCISFNGIPRTINMLGAFRASLPEDVLKDLRTTTTREITSPSLPSIYARGLSLWNSIYAPLSQKLLHKLSSSHPDLPVHILSSHYSALLSDPEGAVGVGRVETSLVAVACLRAQTGVGPQVLSHIFGLRKGVEEENGVLGEGERWLGGDEGCMWVLEMVDAVVETVAGGEGSFAPGFVKAKL